MARHTIHYLDNGSPVVHLPRELDDADHVHVLTDDERAALVERPAWHTHDNLPHRNHTHDHGGAATFHTHHRDTGYVAYLDARFYPRPG